MFLFFKKLFYQHLAANERYGPSLLTFLLPLTHVVGCSVVMETATWVLLLLCVLQVQTLYYSADHKLLDGSLLDGQAEVFGTEDDHIQFVQVHNQR